MNSTPSKSHDSFINCDQLYISTPLHSEIISPSFILSPIENELKEVRRENTIVQSTENRLENTITEDVKLTGCIVKEPIKDFNLIDNIIQEPVENDLENLKSVPEESVKHPENIVQNQIENNDTQEPVEKLELIKPEPVENAHSQEHTENVIQKSLENVHTHDWIQEHQTVVQKFFNCDVQNQIPENNMTSGLEKDENKEHFIDNIDSTIEDQKNYTDVPELNGEPIKNQSHSMINNLSIIKKHNNTEEMNVSLSKQFTKLDNICGKKLENITRIDDTTMPNTNSNESVHISLFEKCLDETQNTTSFHQIQLNNILDACNMTQPIPFDYFINETNLKWKKLGEATYSEVYSSSIPDQFWLPDLFPEYFINMEKQSFPVSDIAVKVIPFG